MPEVAELRRDRELLGRTGSRAHDDMLEEFRRIRRGFRDQSNRSDDILDYHDIYNANLNHNQVYNGNAQLYVPIVRAAIQARKTRFLNQIFPSSGRYIDATSSDSQVPHAIVALLEDYVRKTQLRTQVISTLIRNGDIEGQYNLYVDWSRSSRHIVSRTRAAPRISLPGMPQPIDGPEAEIETIRSEELVEQCPDVEVLHDTDVLVLPTTARSIDDALYSGGSVTIIRRWTKEQLEHLIDRGEVRRRAAEQLLEIAQRESDMTDRNLEKEMIDNAGIRGRGRFFQVWETWKLMDCGDDGGMRLAKILYGGYDLILSCRRNPFWNDKCPLISVPVEKVAGVFKGTSPIAGGVDGMQYAANDIANQAADSATYSMVPIVMTDPAKNPRVSTMLLNLAAIWECDPQSTQVLSMPKLWQDGIAIIGAYTSQIFQILGVNPAMMPQSTGAPGRRRNQAEVAMEQNVDVLTTAEACSILEEGILTPMLTHWVDLDHQYRDEESTVRTYGELGIQAKMERVPPLQSTDRYHFTWFGVEQARNASQQQQQIAFLNMARGLSQDLMAAGYRLNPAPALEHAAGNIFGWRMGRQIVRDARQELSIDPELENQLFEQGMWSDVHMADIHPQHIQAHMPLTQSPDETIAATAKVHIQQHQRIMQQAQMAAMQQQQPGQPGQPGAGGMPGLVGQAGGPPGAPGMRPPVPGGQVPGPRLMRGPPGAIAPDSLIRAGALVPPRRAG